MSDQPKMIMPTDAERMAKRYLIAKGYYDKESVPTREVYAMLMEYTKEIQRMLDMTQKYAMDLINVRQPPVYIVQEKKNN